jgi:NADPH-dependent glutamate synthase beta subunit-like oxidoreductase
LNIKGETLGNVHYAIDYLKSPGVYELGKTVCVVGAGNVAMDAARTAKRIGVESVTVMYRKGYEDMTATRQGVFSAGDVVTGAKTVVEAVNHTKVVAQAIDDYCNSLKEKP